MRDLPVLGAATLGLETDHETLLHSRMILRKSAEALAGAETA
jgi:hypothetical protein